MSGDQLPHVGLFPGWLSIHGTTMHLIPPQKQTQRGIAAHPPRVLQLAPFIKRKKGAVQLVFTSPPYPLNRKKKYGNLSGQEYSKSMKKLLSTGKYNSGVRPSQHDISEKSFLKNNGGAIPPNVLIIANTSSSDPYQKY